MVHRNAHRIDLDRKKSYTFCVLACVYFVLHFLQNHGLGPEVLRFYGKDIILVPFLMLGINATMLSLDIKTRVGIKELILTILTCTIAFEFVFPKFGMAFEPDVLDVFCYIFGGSIYYILFLRRVNMPEIQYILKPDDL